MLTKGDAATREQMLEAMVQWTEEARAAWTQARAQVTEASELLRE